MIPKVIHYTWFSNEPYPPLVQKCMESWHKYLPDYEIKLWNCDNFDVHMNTWCSQAYSAGKYAFVADYARVYLLYHYGGIYLDSDIEIVQNLDELLTNEAFTSFVPYDTTSVEAEIIGSNPGNPLMRKMIDYYEQRNFINEDGSYSLTPITKLMYYTIFNKEEATYNVEYIFNDIHIYPTGFFLWSGRDVIENINKPTAYSIHYGAGSWNTQSSGYLKIHRRYLGPFYKKNEVKIWRIFHICHMDRIMRLFYNKFVFYFDKKFGT